MANRIIRPGRSAWNPGEKPPYGVRLNPYHPLSQGLVGAWLLNEGAGNIDHDLCRNVKLLHQSGLLWSRDGLLCNVLDDGSLVTTPNHLRLNPPLTLVVGFYQLGLPSTLGTFGGWGGVMCNNTDAYPYASYHFLSPNVEDVYQLGYNFDGSYTLLTSGKGVTTGEHQLVGTIENGRQIIYVDGKQENSSTIAINTIQYDASSQLYIGDADPNQRSPNAIIKYLYIYNRALSAQESASLYANPYQMVWHPVYNDLIATAGIFLKTDYWSITAAPQMVANISVISAFLGILVSAVISATSTVVASLNLVEIIRATISAASNVIAALGIRRFISAIITATSNIIANIRSSKFVSAVISAVSSMAANLRLSKFISAIVLGTSNVIAAIKLNKIIRAVISATSSMAANLRLQKIISAIISATSNVIANIRSSKFISAIISTASSMAVNLRLSKFVSAIISAASSMVANLRLQKFMSAVISATSNVIAALNIQKAIAAIIDAVSSMYGNLTTVGRIMISSIIIAATTGVEAALWTRKVISATIDAASSMYGNITAVALRFISATISATSSMYGNVSVALQLAISATIQAISSVSANIFAVRAIAAIITATTNVIASLHAIFSIKAVITGVSGMIADIYKAAVGPVVTAGRHLIGYLKRKIEKAINDFLHIE